MAATPKTITLRQVETLKWVIIPEIPDHLAWCAGCGRTRKGMDRLTCISCEIRVNVELV